MSITHHISVNNFLQLVVSIYFILSCSVCCCKFHNIMALHNAHFTIANFLFNCWKMFKKKFTNNCKASAYTVPLYHMR